MLIRKIVLKMKKAIYSDKKCVVDILVNSFYDNNSVNYIIKQDKKRGVRIKNLMDYSFDLCFYFGEVYLSDDRRACALILFPDKKKNKLKSILLDLKFIISCLDISHLKKAVVRESKIKKLQPTGLKYYLWFIGTEPQYQGKGIGSQLLKDIIEAGANGERPIYLETSRIDNVQWYQKFGFKLYNELDLGYQLYFMKTE
jgi:ribosomal protein S18 acetylase RimI-like enzyme